MSGKGYILLEVDKKGRLHLPVRLREELGITGQVLVEREADALLLKPLEAIRDPVETLLSIRVRTKRTPLEMKREAEEGLFGG